MQGASSGPARAWRTAAPFIRRTAADLCLDRIELADPLQRLLGERRGLRLRAGRRTCAARAPSTPLSLDAARLVELIEAGIAVGLQHAAETRSDVVADRSPLRSGE